MNTPFKCRIVIEIIEGDGPEAIRDALDLASMLRAEPCVVDVEPRPVKTASLPCASTPAPRAPKAKPGPKPKRDPKPDPAGFAAPGGKILICKACGAKFVAPNAKGRAPKYCQDAACRKARGRAVYRKLRGIRECVAPPVPDVPDVDNDDDGGQAEAEAEARRLKAAY